MPKVMARLAATIRPWLARRLRAMAAALLQEPPSPPLASPSPALAPAPVRPPASIEIDSSFGVVSEVDDLQAGFLPFWIKSPKRKPRPFTHI